MKRWLEWTLLAALAMIVAGCDGGGDKNINRNKDKPVAPQVEKPDGGEKK
jgi:hypothetical protein